MMILIECLLSNSIFGRRAIKLSVDLHLFDSHQRLNIIFRTGMTETGGNTDRRLQADYMNKSAIIRILSDDRCGYSLKSKFIIFDISYHL